MVNLQLARIAVNLMREIVFGEWAKLTTISDLARQLNLSTATVSKALNGYRDVAPGTRALVRQRARELGYAPRAAARNLRRGRTDKIALFLNTSIDYVVDYLSAIIPGAVRRAQGYGKSLLLYTIVDDDPRSLLQVCRAGEVDGVILFANHYNRDTIEELLVTGFPFVVLGRAIADERVSYIAPDNYDGAYQATAHLAAQGHQRIAFLSRPALQTAHEARRRGYCDALLAAGIQPDETLIRPTQIEAQSGRAPTRELLALVERPTAIFAFHDLVAVDVINELRATGLRIPQDMAVMGFDGLRAGCLTQPPLSTVRQPLERIGERVIEIIQGRIADPGAAATRETLPVELELRQSA